MNQKKEVYLFFFIILGYYQYNSSQSKNKNIPINMLYHSYSCVSNIRRNNHLLS